MKYHEIELSKKGYVCCCCSYFLSEFGSYYISPFPSTNLKKERKRKYLVQIRHKELEQRNVKSPEGVQIPPKVTVSH